METIYLCIVIFLFVLAVFDLVVGVSNDAVNFLQSAVGAKAASFKTILFIAGIGVFIGAALSNGMMDIARHGIYQPEHFYFAEIMCILLAVMLTDVVLLDVFNTMGMPTSTPDSGGPGVRTVSDSGGQCHRRGTGSYPEDQKAEPYPVHRRYGHPQLRTLG